MRTMYRITAAAPFTGKLGPVPFIDGKTETDHEGVVAYCRRHGYTVEEVEQAAPEATEGGGQGGGETLPVQPQTPPPAKSAPKAAWIEYAVASGMAPADADALTRDQLVDRYAPADGGDA